MIDYSQIKKLAQHHINLHGDAWHGEDSPALASVPTFAAEMFIAAANPTALLALIAENERLSTEAANAIQTSQHFIDGGVEITATIDQLKAENAGLRTGYEAYEQVVQGLKAENEALRKLVPSKEIIWCACGDGHAANSYGAGFMDANNGVCANCDAAMSKEPSHG